MSRISAAAAYDESIQAGDGQGTAIARSSVAVGSAATGAVVTSIVTTAVTGAAVGSVAPGVGTVIGFGVGLLVGAATAATVNWFGNRAIDQF